MLPSNRELEKKLWDAADQLRANSGLRPAEYYLPVLGLIFLKYADYRFGVVDQKIKEEREQTREETGRSLPPLEPEHYQAEGVLFVPDEARYQRLVELPEGTDVSREVINAMKVIEDHNSSLKDVLPKTYTRLSDDILIAFLREFNTIEMDMDGDVFGHIYEYFLSQFAMSEGRRGGEFFTPTSIVRLIVEVIEPFHGRILDPACGSGGMFVQSARFIEEHQGDPDAELSIYGQERVAQTARICQMNLAVHGLEGNIRQGNTYYDDIHNSLEKFDFVMANPPFNVKGVDHERLENDPRFPFGIPSTDNANYLWIQIFYSALNEQGRAGFVMANSAADAGHSEKEIRKKLIEDDAVDVVISIDSNFFFTVTLPCTLWFLDKGKPPERKGKVLFLDARGVYHQIDRAHRKFTEKQLSFLSCIVRLYRDEDLNGYKFTHEGLNLTQPQVDELQMAFSNRVYSDISGLCKEVSIDEISEEGWSLNPGRYVGVSRVDHNNINYSKKIGSLYSKFENLTEQAHELEKTINNNLEDLIDKL